MRRGQYFREDKLHVGLMAGLQIELRAPFLVQIH
jgi:hypothetical protein